MALSSFCCCCHCWICSHLCGRFSVFFSGAFPTRYLFSTSLGLFPCVAGVRACCTRARVGGLGQNGQKHRANHEFGKFAPATLRLVGFPSSSCLFLSRLFLFISLVDPLVVLHFLRLPLPCRAFPNLVRWRKIAGKKTTQEAARPQNTLTGAGPAWTWRGLCGERTTTTRKAVVAADVM